MSEAEELRLLLPQREHLADDRAVVPLAARRARDVRAVHRLAERPIVGEAHDRAVRRCLEREPEARLALLLRALLRGRDRALGEAREPGAVLDDELERSGRIDDVLREPERELGERDVDLREAGLPLLVELGAVPAKVCQRLLQEARASRIEALRGIRLGELAERPVERLGEHDLARERAHLRQDLAVGRAHLRRSVDGLEMAGDVHREVELARREVERAERGLIRARRRTDRVEPGLRLCDERIDGGLDVLGTDLVKRNGNGDGRQRIVHGHRRAHARKSAE